MEFTKEQRDQYLDQLALMTKQQMWQVEMALMKSTSQLAKKKALLEELEQKLENKEFSSNREGKNQIKFTQDKITELESEIEESHITLKSGEEDLELIESYRKS